MSENILIIITLQLLFNKSGITVTILWNMTVLSLYIICIKVQRGGPLNWDLLKKIVIIHCYYGTDLQWALVKGFSSIRFLAWHGVWVPILGSVFPWIILTAVLLMNLSMETYASFQRPGDVSCSQLCLWKLVCWCRTN